VVPALLILFWLSFSLRILNGDVDNCYLSLTTAKRCASPLISHVVFTIMLQVKCCSCLTDRKPELCRVTRCWRLHQFSSVTQLCPTLCDPMNCSTPGLPVHHHLLEFTQTHIHQVSDAIQPSHLLSSPSPPALSPSSSFPQPLAFPQVISSASPFELLNLAQGTNYGSIWFYSLDFCEYKSKRKKVSLERRPHVFKRNIFSVMKQENSTGNPT